jgi:ferric-dicitrate binding protein FerR (iron transport regulator)
MNPHSLPSDLNGSLEDEDRHEYERLWSLLQETPDPAFDVDAAWNELSAELDLDRPGEAADAASGSATVQEASGRPVAGADRPAAHADRGARRGAAADRSGPWWRPRAAAAAAFFILVLGGAVLWWQQPVRVATAAGEQTTVTLPDGSTAELNGATRLRYPRGFAWLPGWEHGVRQVTLTGEAYFSVRSGSRSFRVQTPNARVDVLGTEFNVHARHRDGLPVTEVVLAHGRVRLRGGVRNAPGETTSKTTGEEPPKEKQPLDERHGRTSEPVSVLLDAAGARSRVRGHARAPEPPDRVDLSLANAWRTRGFAVQDAPLPVILRELEVQFGTDLRLQAPSARTRPMTLHYARSVQLEDVLGDICRLQGLQYRETSDGFVLAPARR